MKELNEAREAWSKLRDSEDATFDEEIQAYHDYRKKSAEYTGTPEGIARLRELGETSRADELQLIHDEKMMAWRRVQEKHNLPQNVQNWLNNEETRELLDKTTAEDHPWLQDFKKASDSAGEAVFPHDPRIKEGEKLRVGFDIDEVIYPWTDHFRTYVLDKEGHKDEECPPLTRYDGFVGEWKFGSREEFVEAMHRAEHHGVNIAGPPKEHSVATVHRILNDGHEVHIVTARAEHDGRTHTETKQWLEEHGVQYTSFSISFDKRSVPTDLFIDDKPGNCDDLKSAGTLPVMMGVPFNDNDRDHLKVKDLSVWGDIVNSFSRWRA